jgi:hypothetical protein
MSAGLWVLTGWFAAAAIFALGCFWGGRYSRDLEAACAAQAEVIAGLKAAQNHEGCLEVIRRLWTERDRVREYADFQEARADGRVDLDGELRRLLEGGGAA